MKNAVPLPDPHLVHALAILDVLETALIATTQSVSADHPGVLLDDHAPADPTAAHEAAAFLCATAESTTAALRDYRLSLLNVYDF